MSRVNPLAYDLKPFAPPGDLRPAAHLRCVSCPEVGKIIVSGFGNNPEKIEKYFIRLGWDASVHNSSSNYCPKCVKNRAIRAGEEARKRKEQPPGLVAAIRTQALSPPQEKPVQRGEKPPMIKSLTPEQKAALRNELGGTFDESSGRYLDGNSDRAISEKLGIPMVAVVEFRENFYGELKDDPEITAFATQLAELKKVLGNLSETARKMEVKLEDLRRKAGV